MNRSISLPTHPVLYKAFYLAFPAVFIFFTLAILVSCFGFSFQEAQQYWPFPALIGGAFLLYVSFVQGNRHSFQSQQNAEISPDILKQRLDKTYRSIRYGMMCYIGTAVIRVPFSHELGQMADLLALCCFLAMGAYFREILCLYLRDTKVSNEEIKNRFIQKGAFLIAGWIVLGAFFFKAKGGVGGWLFNFQLSNLLLALACIVYLVGVLGVSLFANREKSLSVGIFNSCLAFGTTFPLAWGYDYVHPYLFIDIPAWMIQLPILALSLLASFGIYFSSQSGLREKILGHSCLWFIRYAAFVLAFIFLWAISVRYADMNPQIAFLFYGSFFAFISWIENRTPRLVMMATIIVVGPLLSRILDFLLK